MSSNQPSAKQIKEAIDKSGYLLESQIGYLLKEHRYLVTPNYNFEDAETGESREIDLLAEIGYLQINLGIILRQLLLIECKKISYPLVFFSKPSYNELKSREEYFEIVGVPESVDAEESRGVVSLEHYLELSKFSHRYKSHDTSSQFCLISRKGKGWHAKHEPIYNSMIVPLIKCLSSHKKRYREMVPKNLIQLQIIYPVVIVDSELYLMNSETNEMGTREWILFYRHYESKSVKLTAMIDFVRYKHIDAYLEMIKTSLETIYSRVKDEREWLLNIIKAKKFYMED